MARYRKPPVCLKCHLPYKAIHRKINKALTFIGDTFLKWEHKCEKDEKQI